MPQIIIVGGGPRYTYAGAPARQTLNSSFTFSAAAIGSAETTRYVVVAVLMSTTATNFAISGVTIDGNAATHHVTDAGSGTTAGARAALYGLAVPSGTTADIVVTFAGSVSNCQIAVWALYDLASTTPADTGNDSGGNGDTSATATLDVPAEGILIAPAVFFGAVQVQTLAGVTEDGQVAVTSLRMNWGSRQATDAETAASVTHSGTAGAATARAIVAASWS